MTKTRYDYRKYDYYTGYNDRATTGEIVLSLVLTLITVGLAALALLVL